MILGREYTADDVLQALRRRKWLIIVPFVLLASGTAAYTYRLPNLYKSETLILVVPQRVPESYVRSTVTTRIQDRLRSIQDEITSRSRLEPIITELNLYAELRRKLPMEEIVAVMRNDIEVETVKEDSFRVRYVSGDPRVAMEVTKRLAAMFINENLRDRETLADGTNKFLESQLDLARTRLKEHETKLEAYKSLHSGELPAQLQTNLQVVQTNQLQLSALEESINRDRDRRLVLERALSEVKDGEVPVADAAGTPVDPLEQARTELAALRAHLKPTHPDVMAQMRRVKELEDQQAAAPASAPATTAAAPRQPNPATQRHIRETAQEMEKVDAQIASKQREALRLQKTIAEYQRRVEAVPTLETDMTALNRDYDTLLKSYQNLLANKEASTISANLERQQAGEQFKVLDPARVPEVPFSPKRLQLNVLGAGIGLFLGLAWGVVWEYKDTSLRTEEQLVAVLKLPVLAIVPVLDSMAQRRRRKLRLILSAVVVVISAGGIGAAWKLGFLARFL